MFNQFLISASDHNLRRAIAVLCISLLTRSSEIKSPIRQKDILFSSNAARNNKLGSCKRLITKMVIDNSPSSFAATFLKLTSQCLRWNSYLYFTPAATGVRAKLHLQYHTCCNRCESKITPAVSHLPQPRRVKKITPAVSHLLQPTREENYTCSITPAATDAWRKLYLQYHTCRNRRGNHDLHVWIIYSIHLSMTSN